MTTPETINKTATVVNAVIDGSISTIETVTESLIVAEVPFLGLPVIKQIWEGLLHWILRYASKAAQTGATFAVIDAQVNTEKSNLSEALAALIAAEKTGDPNVIKIAIQNYAKAQSALINSNGSASPQ